MSIKFPKQYKVAAHLLQIASEEDINVKHILYNDKKYQHYNIKSLYAIVTKALQNWEVIETLMKESNILTEHSGLNIWRVRVIISELIIDHKDFPNPENYTLRTVIQYQEKFKKILSKTHTKSLIGSNARSETDVAKVRFIKINLIKNNVKSVIEKFQEDSWEKLETASNYDDYLQQLRDLEPNSPVFLQDFHFQEVLAFPPGTELQSHELYFDGSVFFMDKASCLPPFLLAPKRNGHVLDMCAAPGLKTVQLASYVTSGKVYAVERDAGRYNTLQMMVEQSGAGNVITVLRDVTKLNVDQYKHVEYILVDPSCTGSVPGVNHRMQHTQLLYSWVKPGPMEASFVYLGIRARQPSAILKARLDEKTRVEKLSGFQLTLLRFALTRFPAAKRVVYSTCSLNVEENEEVVEAALNSYYHNFDVVSIQDKLPGWQNFGSKDFQFGSKCIYCQPGIDQTNGFFVAVFERNKNQSYTSGVDCESNKGKSENHFKGNKRRIHEEHYGSGNEHLKISSHKRLKLEYNQAETNEKDEVIAPTLLNNGKTKRVKANGKELSLSEKKRSRRKMLKIKILSQSSTDTRKKLLKIKKKILPQSSTDKSTKDKIKNHGPNDLVGKIDKNKCFNKNSNKISRAQLRRKREKKVKLNLASGSNNSKIKNQTISKATINLDLWKTSEGDTEKLKGRENNHENLIESTESGNAPRVKKIGKRKGGTTEVNEHERVKSKNVEGKIRSYEIINTNPRIRDIVKKKKKKVSSQIIETDENGQTLKRKHKKDHSLKHENTKIDQDFDIKENSDKVSDPDESYKNIKEINSKNRENEKVWSQKHKKKLLLDQHENNITGTVNGDNKFYKATPGDINEKNSKEILSKSDESGDGETLKKKLKKKQSSNQYDSNITNHIHNKIVDKASDKTTEEIFAESNDREEKRTRKKKHKKKRS